MKKSLLILAAASCALTVSCQKQEAVAPALSNAIDFRADFGHYAFKATDTSFEEADAVGIFALDPINSYNVKYTVMDGKLTSQNPICWLDGQTNATDFVLVYPYMSGLDDINSDYEFTVNADQSTHALYTTSDLMTGHAQASPSAKSVCFDVQHVLSKVVITINNLSSKRIKDVYLSDVYGKFRVSLSAPITATGSKGTIKACPVSIDSAAAWVMIVPPQTSQPSLVVTTADNEQITYTLPSEVTFRSGRQSSANVTLSEESTFTDFTTQISDWIPDNELQFSDGGGSGDNWKSIGTGKFLDGILSYLFGIPPFELDVEYFHNTSNPGAYMIKDPYKNHPYASVLGYKDGGAIYFNVNQDGSAYIKESPVGLSYSSWGNISFYSLCPENGISDEDAYFYSSYEGCWQASDYNPYVIVGFSNGNAYLSNAECMTVFTLPGHIRMPVFYEFKVDQKDFFDSDSKSLTFTKGFDLTRVAASVLPGRVTVTNDILQETLVGRSAGQVYYNTNETGYEISGVPSGVVNTGVYTAIMVGDCTYADGKDYWGYYVHNFTYVAPGDTAPQCKPEIVSVAPDSSNPSSNIVMSVKVSDVKSCYYYALPKAEFEKLGIAESLYCDLVYSKGHFAPGTIAAFQGEGQKIVIGSLTPSTEYVVLVAATNLFDQQGWAKATVSTGGELQFKSIGTGKYYDYFAGVQFIQSKDGTSVTEYSTDVEILQEASGKPIYRVLNPYKALMDSKPTLYSDAIYYGAASDMIQFHTHQYPTGNYVFFEPYYNGISYYGDLIDDGIMEHPYLYTHGSGDVYDEPDRYTDTYLNIEIADGVFQLAPVVEIGGTNFIYDIRNSQGAVIIVLPGATYPLAEDTKASVKNTLKTRMPVSKVQPGWSVRR